MYTFSLDLLITNDIMLKPLVFGFHKPWYAKTISHSRNELQSRIINV